MTKESFTINVSGGNTNFGNISLGDNNKLSTGSQTINTQVQAAFDESLNALNELKQEDAAKAEKIDALQKELVDLKSQIKPDGNSTMASIGKTAKKIYENYSWAGPILKKLFLSIIPGIAL